MKVKRFLFRAFFGAIAGCCLFSSSALALEFEWDIGDGISGVLNTGITLGAAWRMEDRADHLVGKSNLNPDICPVKQCQGIFQGDVSPNCTY